MPSFVEHPTLTGTYVDNVCVLGRTRELVVTRSRQMEKASHESQLPLDWTCTEPVTTLGSLGVQYLLRRRLLINDPRRVWRTILAGEALLRRRRLHGDILRIWNGHVCHLLQLARPALAAMSAVYRFSVVALGRRMEVWPSVQQEIRGIQGLLLLTVVNLAQPFSSTVGIGDASGGGFALLEREASRTQIQQAWRYRERWRFVRGEERRGAG